MSLKSFLTEARRSDLNYVEKKTKGVVERVIVTLEGSDSAQATKLARRFHNTKKAIDVLKKKQVELDEKLIGMAGSLFDDAMDQVLTRVVETATFTITLAKKQQKGTEKSELNFDEFYAGLTALIDESLKPKIDELLAQHTKKWTTEAPKQSVRVTPKEDVSESVLADAGKKLAAMGAELKKQLTALLKSVKTWGKTYDAKLKELKRKAKLTESVSAKAEPAVVEIKGYSSINVLVCEDEIVALEKVALYADDNKTVLREWPAGSNVAKLPGYGGAGYSIRYAGSASELLK